MNKNDLYIEKSSLENVNKDHDPPTCTCPGIDHEDKNPSAIVYSDKVFCPVCCMVWRFV